VFFGGLGIPLPLTHGFVAVPSAGFSQEPHSVKGLGPNSPLGTPPSAIPLVASRADLPTTLDYAVRVTQREHPHFSFDIGVGQVAGNIGSTIVPVALPSPPYVTTVNVPVNLKARSVLGLGLSYRY
jgi:hypothetical protein